MKNHLKMISKFKFICRTNYANKFFLLVYKLYDSLQIANFHNIRILMSVIPQLLIHIRSQEKKVHYKVSFCIFYGYLAAGMAY